MPETFAQFLDKWLKQSTAQGLNNPLVKMPVKRFRPLQPVEFDSVANGGTLVVGTLSDPISRNLFKNFQTRIRERGEHCAFICAGSVEMSFAAGVGQQSRTALFPICLKRASLQTHSEQVKATIAEEEPWQFNPVLEAHLRGINIRVPPDLKGNPAQAINWVQAQLGNRATQVNTDSYLGLFSSQQMVVQARLTEPSLRQSLARNPVIKAKIEQRNVQAVALSETTDEGLEELGLVLPCDDSQLRVVQLSALGCCLQVEGPPGTGKSQTIANIISNALYHGHRALLVCDKRAAIVQVEERLSHCGLQPAILNLHDEDLDKRDFLKQATDQFVPPHDAPSYPFSELSEVRKTLNERVRFGRATAHPSLQVAKREALAGLIQLRKELRDVPNIEVANWQALSRERLTKLLACVGEWPDLAAVLTDFANIWNLVLVQGLDDNPNAANELQGIVKRIVTQIASLDELREWAASVGVEMPIKSDADVKAMLDLVEAVLDKPLCHPKMVGNSQLSVSELNRLKSHWDRRQELIAARHPVPLTHIHSANVQTEAQDLLALEHSTSWNDLSQREAYYTSRLNDLEDVQASYLRICDQIGLVYSPSLKVRRAQLQSVHAFGALLAAVPRGWWETHATPVLSIANWKAHLRACATLAKSAAFPLHFVALERVAATHWDHVERKAERGFNMVSYCFQHVNDRKCKYALRQVFPAIPPRRFKQWQEVTLQAVAARHSVAALRSVSGSHVILQQLTSAYLAVAHEPSDDADTFLSHPDVQMLEKAGARVEQMRGRNDLFEVGNIHWQSFWEGATPGVLSHVSTLLSRFDSLDLPHDIDNVEETRTAYSHSRERIQSFLGTYETLDGERTNGVMQAFSAQVEFSYCERQLAPLAAYLDLQVNPNTTPDWQWLQQVLVWRDTFERLCGQQKLDVDSAIWPKLREALARHQVTIADAQQGLAQFFANCVPEPLDHDALVSRMAELLAELPRHPLWLEKKRWQLKLSGYPELKTLWSKILDGTVKPEHAQRLLCFNLLRLCDPVAKPHGLELRQTLRAFNDQDEKLASWIIGRLKATLRRSMQEAAASSAHSDSELRRLSSLQRIRGTVRELVNAHLDYLLAAKRCWMMSPTSLANFIDAKTFDDHGTPFDLVIFDEASQIRVLDGLLSMSFGKQVIIVGDKHQLPPTDFFAGFADPSAETEGQEFGVSESLLDEFGGVFETDQTQVMLMSHYRSETPDLIRFSNDWFYD